MLKDIVRHHLEGTRFGIKVDPARRPADAGRGGLPADLDGCQGRRLGGHAAPRQGRRDQRALVQRAAPAGRLAARRARPGSRRDRRPCRQGAPNRSIAASGSRPGGYLYDVVDGENGDDAAFRPNQIFAISLDHPVLDRERWEAVVTAVHSETGDAGRAALAGAGRARLQAALFRRSARPRRGLSPGHGVGLADRPIHRCLAQGASR